MRVLVPFATLLSVVHAVTISNFLGYPTDVCASVNAELVVPDLLGVLTAVGVINICLCISQISIFLENNIVGILAVTIAGERATTDAITILINAAVGPNPCEYPKNSIPTCIPGIRCGFTCANNFLPLPVINPTDCVCPDSNLICDGVCTAAGSCPSPTPSRRGESWWQKRMSCDFGLTACGSTASSAYDCVDTKTNLENCGGCNILLNDFSPKGRDCSAIPGVASVSCDRGACSVHECMSGYTASFDNSTCYDKDQFSLANEALQKYRNSGFN